MTVVQTWYNSRPTLYLGGGLNDSMEVEIYIYTSNAKIAAYNSRMLNLLDMYG